MLAGIEDGPLTGAALDVFDPEPPDFDHPIFRHPAVLTAPHAMAMTRGAMDRMAEMMSHGHGGGPRMAIGRPTWW